MAKTVLVADDIEPNRKLLNARLQHGHYKTLMAADGEETLEQAKDQRPDIIMIDLMMPGMNGFETGQALRCNPETADIPIIFITALDDDNTIMQQRPAFGDGCLIKPFDDTTLFQQIQSAISAAAERKAIDLHLRTSETLALKNRVPFKPDSNNEPDVGINRLLLSDSLNKTQNIRKALEPDDSPLTVISPIKAEAVEIHLAKLDEKKTVILVCADTLPALQREQSAPPATIWLTSHKKKRQAQAMISAGRISSAIFSSQQNPDCWHGYEIRSRIKTLVDQQRRRLTINSLLQSLPKDISHPASGLPQKKYLVTFLTHLLEQNSADEQTAGLIKIQVNDIESMRENFGDRPVERLICEMSRRLMREKSIRGMIAQTEQDTFEIVIPMVDRDTLFTIAETIQRDLTLNPYHPFHATAKPPKIVVSVGGLILRSGTTINPEKILGQLDDALLHARASGDNCIYFDGMGLISSQNRI